MFAITDGTLEEVTWLADSATAPTPTSIVVSGDGQQVDLTWADQVPAPGNRVAFLTVLSELSEVLVDSAQWTEGGTAIGDADINFSPPPPVRPAIPAVWEWEVVMIGLMTLAYGTIVLRNRRREMAA